ncbi:DNA-binding transcriptional regulator, LacI/PurR family [Treponema bryantii]|uniref:DNA-binding transcriptional regulator, LacI/PurR family n=1 Tax=Treponema bryantii TaxID=163 RepID=A0A1I3M4B3_9SPIR|nr:substrate-binding domain-containing protein [Treponema bryantii]SFI91803.1 DNA-binding transcriptional regulator, LacI/PurR family [Treponema bryantii]
MRIGVVLNILDEEYQISVYKGIEQKARSLGVELVCFQQENAKITEDEPVSRFPKKEYFDLDGIILVTSVITGNADFTTKADVERIWGNLPVISVGQRIEGIPSVLIETEDSMKQLVEHLILNHKYRKFLFISGAEDHPDAEEREQIFTKTMEAYKPWFADLQYKLKRGYFTEVAAIRAMTEYMEEEKTSPDVVVCANDNMAIGVYKYFKINPKIKECAVTGFDDIPQARFEIPSLTTVHQPLSEIGAKSLELIVELKKGKSLPQEVFIESRVVYRKSCGCKGSKDDFASDEEQFRAMQANYVQSETLLRMVSHIGQDLNYGESFGALKYVVRQNLNQLGLNNFCILRFSSGNPKGPHLKNMPVDPLFVRRSGNECYEFDREMRMPLGQFYRRFYDIDPQTKPSMILKFLNAGNELIGCIFYEADENVLPYLSSIAINIAHGLNRITIADERRKRSEFLEREVNERTKELVEANNRRMEVEAEILKISELERQRFSNDLHDDICQRLAGISMLCRSYSNQDTPVEKSQMLELAQLIGETLATTRQYAHNSYPVELESLGMNHSLSNLCNTFMAQSGINCEYEWGMPKGVHFDKIQKLNIFRIIQEALHNVLKHSKAKNVWVSVKPEARKTVIKIVDDGVGFLNDSEENGKGNNKGLGLNSMQYRANQIGASFVIKSNKPNGTCVQLSLSNKLLEDKNKK